MSALFEDRADNVIQSTTLKNTLEIRQTPLITEVQTSRSVLEKPDPGYQAIDVLNMLLLDPPKNWLPGAAIQLSLNGTELAWTHEGWSFIPLDFGRIPNAASNGNNIKTIANPVNITVSTPALRARLECNPISEVADASTWLTHPDDTMFPTHESYNLTGLEDYYTFNHTIFDGSPPHTSAFANQNTIRCCSNGTSNNPQRAAIGYRSPTDVLNFPHADDQWPLPFVTKWIVGKPRTLLESSVKVPTSTSNRLLPFKDIPSIQAARCMPVIEVVDSTVLLDRESGIIHSHQITGTVSSADSAWLDAFIRHGLSNSSQRYTTNYTGPLNMTTSYGILFMDSMFNAADPYLHSVGRTYFEPLNDNAFVMRDQDQGLNMDLMTYSMYNLAKKDPDALLDYATLVKHANHTFQTFFQHFVSNGMTMTGGGLAYQRINDDSLEALGPCIAANGTTLPQHKYTKLNTNQTVDAWVSNRVQVLHMDTLATYLSVAILIWLLGTTAIVACLQRKYIGSMIRDVQLVADVLVLIAGSDNFLRLIHERGAGLKRDEEVKTMLGWFKDSNNEIRWGVEVVGGRDAVEWVDSPKKGWHVREKRSWMKRDASKEVGLRLERNCFHYIFQTSVDVDAVICPG